MFIFQSPGEIAFTVFGFSVYWYGIMMALAVFAAVFCANFLAKKTDLPDNFFIDYSPIFIIIGLLGARLYYCLLNFEYYLYAPLEIFDIRQGGLSIHGMLLIGIFLVYFIAKRYKLSFLLMADVLACSVVLAQAIGRWGNFFNSEAFGRPMTSSWGLYIKPIYRPSEFINYQYFHPTFLYESIADLLIFAFLIWIFKSNKCKTGMVFFAYLILYSIVRFVIEGFRVDSALDIYGMPVAQIISIVLIFCGICGLVLINKKSEP
ncbi:MAG: prolipoprotein diacylglyceryl transferase [Cyanobacteria bacterium SIG32]|nr:prolipoprotein diacylglyceryl transferase [Cyanobacteria bacterium SIG32]